MSNSPLNVDSTVATWIKGFAARVDAVMRLAPPHITDGGLDAVAIADQYHKVLRCIDSALRTNGKTVNNLRTASERLNTMLCNAEDELRETL